VRNARPRGAAHVSARARVLDDLACRLVGYLHTRDGGREDPAATAAAAEAVHRAEARLTLAEVDEAILRREQGTGNGEPEPY